jgi:hypothetical protein
VGRPQRGKKHNDKKKNFSSARPLPSSRQINPASASAQNNPSQSQMVKKWANRILPSDHDIAVA